MKHQKHAQNLEKCPICSGRIRMIGIRELAAYIGLKPQTIRNKLSCGTFPIPTKKIGRLLKWDIRDVEKYLDNLTSINS